MTRTISFLNYSKDNKTYVDDVSTVGHLSSTVASFQRWKDDMIDCIPSHLEAPNLLSHSSYWSRSCWLTLALTCLRAAMRSS